MSTVTASPENKFLCADYQYCGWVPCLSGELDFSLMSVGLAGNEFTDTSAKSTSLFKRLRARFSPGIDNNTHSVNYLGQTSGGAAVRRIVLQSWYNWQDQQPGDGQFRIVVTAQVQPEGSTRQNRALTGHIAIFPREWTRKKNGQTPQHLAASRFMNLFGDLETEWKQLPGQYHNHEAIPHPDTSAIDGLWEALDTRLDSGHPLGNGLEFKEVYVVSFTVDPGD